MDPQLSPLLVARNLWKTYPSGADPALRGIDITVNAGEIFGLLGPNGAGKTTAISIMSSLLRPDAGSVTINGVDPFRFPARGKSLFGLVPQDIALYPTLTVVENFRYFGKLYGLKGRELDRRIRECLAVVGLEARADRRVETFSGGMKRRANLAVAILHDPKLIFLDEPTVGIDAQSRNMILEELIRLRAMPGRGMIYTTHYMEEAEQICSRVAIIDEGEIRITGTPAELVAQNDGCRNLGDLFLRLTGKRLRD